MLSEALASRRQILGSDHPDTILSLNNLASLHMHTGNDMGAEPLLVEAVRRACSALGGNHPNTIKYAKNLWALRERRRILAKPLNKWQRTLKGNERFKEMAMADASGRRRGRWGSSPALAAPAAAPAEEE